MISKASIMNKDGSMEEVQLYNRLSFDERLDEQLDTGNIQIITDSESVSFDDFCPVKITLIDEDGNVKNIDFCAFRSVEKRGADYFIHSLELVEPTRVLMGAVIEGKKVTQPIGSGVEKASLWNVLNLLIKTFETLQWSGSIVTSRFLLDKNRKSILSKTESPEFHWEAGTLLWECLCDIGNVINAIPRIIVPSNGIYTITFDLINETESEYEL